MYTFTLTDHMLTPAEQLVFSAYLKDRDLDAAIWPVFSSLFTCGDTSNTPLMLRAYTGTDLIGAAVIIKCKKYGKALFNNRLLSGLMDGLGIPFYLWIKYGCGMDMLSNPGFSKRPEQADELFSAMSKYLGQHSILTIINDYSINAIEYPEASELPALPHGCVDTSSFTTLADYAGTFKNLRRKIKTFHNKGGELIRVSGQLNEDLISSLTRCFLSTTENSVFYLPYQQLYLRAAQQTSQTSLDQVYYFIAMLNGEMIGYQAAIQTGRHLNALHGAFDRTMKTTYHAYDLLFVNMTEFAIEHELNTVDFGAVLNVTKQKMVNWNRDLSYFILSKYRLIRWLFSVGLKWTKIQGKKQMKFRS